MPAPIEDVLNYIRMRSQQALLAGHFRMVNEPTMPVVAFSLSKADGKDRVYDEYDVMFRIREYRWMLPAYSCPENAKYCHTPYPCMNTALATPSLPIC